MLIIIDQKAPAAAKDRLKGYGELLELETQGIVTEPVSGHPDIFMCQVGGSVILAPQTPEYIRQALLMRRTRIIEGGASLSASYPGCAAYNALVTGKYLIHRIDATDRQIRTTAQQLGEISVRQAFTRCSLLSVGEGFITSDCGIFKKLTNHGSDVLYVNPSQIILPGHRHGLFGGCCGISGNILFVMGALNRLSGGERIKDFVTCRGFDIVELLDGPLFDGGGIYFFEEKTADSFC